MYKLFSPLDHINTYNIKNKEVKTLLTIFELFSLKKKTIDFTYKKRNIVVFMIVEIYYMHYIIL